MAFLAEPSTYPYAPGALYLGLDDHNREIGFPLERHALTIAGAGAGKGACLLIPNALRWPGNLLAVDPKGENVEKTWQAREALGQQVYVLDPFNVADIPDRLRASFNPLDSITLADPTGRENLEMIADGLVKRSNPHHEEWYDGAASILAGVAAYVVETAPADHRNLTALRAVLLQDREALHADAQRMQACQSFGGLAREAGLTIQTALESDKGMEKDFLGGARRYTKWLDSPLIAATIGQSTFSLTDLKRGRASVYLVLPPQYLETHAAYLRLFVRAAIEAMMADGVKNAGRCLFLLDEFYSLGRLDIVAKAAGLMRAYGLHLWPFLQDISQLTALYNEISETFFANADAAVFFGNSDQPSLEYASRRLGVITLDDLDVNPPTRTNLVDPTLAAAAARPIHQPRPVALPMPRASSSAAVVAGVGGLINLINTSDHRSQVDRQSILTNQVTQLRDLEARADEMAMRSYQHALQRKGQPRLPPDAVAAVVGKGPTDIVARGMLVFLRDGKTLCIAPHPYFLETAPPKDTPATEAAQRHKREISALIERHSAAQRVTDSLNDQAEARALRLIALAGVGAVALAGVLHFAAFFLWYWAIVFGLAGGVLIFALGVSASRREHDRLSKERAAIRRAVLKLYQAIRYEDDADIAADFTAQSPDPFPQLFEAWRRDIDQDRGIAPERTI